VSKYVPVQNIRSTRAFQYKNDSEYKYVPVQNVWSIRTFQLKIDIE
jgi:hypothetical protein